MWELCLNNLEVIEWRAVGDNRGIKRGIRKVGNFQDYMIMMVLEKLPVSSQLKIGWECLIKITNINITRTIQNKYDMQAFSQRIGSRICYR